MNSLRRLKVVEDYTLKNQQGDGKDPSKRSAINPCFPCHDLSAHMNTLLRFMNN